ncbi:hypothetical protein KKK_27060 [Pseudomonas putida B6-2]|nr:hypothetical protein KKK_27060 [Pseudomonas putida B6-2]
MHFEAWFVGGGGTELAQVHGLSRVDAQAQFLLQLAHQRLYRRFTGIDLAAWLHESLGATLAHQQRAALRVDQQGGGDADDVGHEVGSLNKMTREDPMGSLA